MAVAKSYETMQIVDEPFEENHKMYVHVRGICSRCGGSGHYSYNQMDGTRCYGCNGTGKTTIKVRWYTDSQRASMDKAAEKRKIAIEQKKEERRVKFAARNSFGFGEEGYIILLWGDNDEIKSWRENLPRFSVMYNNIFGWYMPSTYECDTIVIPETIKHQKLNWEQVRDENDEENLQMKDNAEVKKIVESITFEPSNSEFQGEIGKWLEKKVIIKKRLSFESSYGISNMHIMEDDDENVYIWSTASKSLEENKTYMIKMKVKEHKEYKGTKQTVVWYCKVK